MDVTAQLVADLSQKYVGTGNFIKAWNDPQFWTSLEFTLKYTLLITLS